MKKLFIIIFALLSLVSYASSKYYLDATGGSDGGLGTIGSPWQTITKVNTLMASLVPGDTVFFKAGQVFVGKILFTANGTTASPIVLDRYGTGANPIITGEVILAPWTNLGGGVYSAACATCTINLNMVTVDGGIATLGRYPNTGWLTYTSHSGSTSITDANASATNDWSTSPSAEIVITKQQWVIDRQRIVTQTGTTGPITYTFVDPSIYGLTDQFKYFIQNDVRTLDAQYEWYLDTAAKVLKMWFGAVDPTQHVIKAATSDTGINLSSKHDIRINNLEVDYTNVSGIQNSQSSTVVVNNCTFNNHGGDGIKGVNTANHDSVLNCTFHNILNTAASLPINFSYAGVMYNTATNTGMIPGMNKSGDLSCLAFNAQGLAANVSYNIVDTAGYRGISVEGDSFFVYKNFVNHYCFIKGDGAGIYTYQATALPTKAGRFIRDNIVINGMDAGGIGSVNGSGRGFPQPSNTYLSLDFSVRGIYCDGYSMNTIIDSNLVMGSSFGSGFYHSVLTQGLKFANNKIYDCLFGINIGHNQSSPDNDTIINNLVVSRRWNQRFIFMPEALALTWPPNLVGIINNNTYYNPFNHHDNLYYSNLFTSKIISEVYGLAAWKALYGQDVNSTETPWPQLTEYSGVTTGSNLFTNGTFTSSTSMSLFSTLGNGSNTFDGASPLDGGAAKIAWSSINQTADNRPITYQAVGAVANTDNIIINFSSIGTKANGTLGVYLRSGTSPNAALTPVRYVALGTGRTETEIMFATPTADANAQLVWKLNDVDSTFWLDNISVKKTTAITITNPDNFIRVVYNNTLSPASTSLAGTYVDQLGNRYTNTILLQPFTSAILMPSTLPGFIKTRKIFKLN